MFKPTLKTALWTSVALSVLGGVSFVASAQTVSSPFASKKTNAWETAEPAPAPPAQTYTAPSTALPLRGSNLSFEAPAAPVQTYQAPAYQAPSYVAPSTSYDSTITSYPTPEYSGPAFQDVPGYSVTPGSSSSEYLAPARLPDAASYAPPVNGTHESSAAVKTTPVTPSNIREMDAPSSSPYYPGRADRGAGIGAYESAPQDPYSAQGYPQQTQQGYPPQNAAQAPQYGAPPQPGQAARGSWKDRFGFGDLVTSVKGFLRIGAAATDRDGWDADFIADGKVSGEVSAITEGGLEYGLGAEVRGQYDKYRRGFGGLVGDCPATVPGCVSTDINGTPTAYRGHTSQFYSSGPSNAKEGEIALEGAYLFLRSSYGDVTVGRDDGAAYLFSLGAPRLMAVNASNSPVDFTGLDSVKTVNDASGFAERITYVSPRLLGDNIGFGIQVGASYAPDAKACGVDYCVRKDGKDGTDVISPDMKDVIEAGISLDRTFANGLKVEGTATYATASEDSQIAAFDNLQAYNFGFDVTYDDWRMGGSYLDSNNGLASGDYKAWDVGVTWKPAAWGVTASYGQAIEDNIRVKSNQVLLGGTYDFEKFTLGAGVQHNIRKAPVNTGGIITIEKEKATSVFIQGAVTF